MCGGGGEGAVVYFLQHCLVGRSAAPQHPERGGGAARRRRERQRWQRRQRTPPQCPRSPPRRARCLPPPQIPHVSRSSSHFFFRCSFCGVYMSFRAQKVQTYTSRLYASPPNFSYTHPPGEEKTGKGGGVCATFRSFSFRIRRISSGLNRNWLQYRLAG